MADTQTKPDLSGFDMVTVMMSVQFEYDARARACLDVVNRTIGMLLAIADLVKERDPFTAVMIHEKANELRELERVTSTSLYASRKALTAHRDSKAVTRARKRGGA